MHERIERSSRFKNYQWFTLWLILISGIHAALPVELISDSPRPESTSDNLQLQTASDRLSFENKGVDFLLCEKLCGLGGSIIFIIIQDLFNGALMR